MNEVRVQCDTMCLYFAFFLVHDFLLSTIFYTSVAVPRTSNNSIKSYNIYNILVYTLILLEALVREWAAPSDSVFIALSLRRGHEKLVS